MKGERRLAQVGSDAVVARKRGRRGRVAALVGAWLGLVVWAAASYAPLDQLGVELYRPYFLPCATVLSLWLPLSRAIDWVRTRRVESGAVYLLLAVGSVLAGRWSDAVLILSVGTSVSALRASLCERASQPVEMWQEVLDAAQAAAQTSSQVTDDGGLATVVVPTDTVVPYDGFVLGDGAWVASFWAESPTVSLEPEDPVFAGDINLGDPLSLVVARSGADTVLSRTVAMGQAALCQGEGANVLLSALNRWSLVCTIAAVVMAVGLPVLWGASVKRVLVRSMSLVALAIPGAWSVAAELPHVAAVGAALRRGVIPMYQSVLSRVARLRMLVVVNVTTITSRQALVVDVLPLKPQACAPDELLTVAAAVETAARASHPFARAIRRASRNEKLALPHAEQGRQWPGLGVSALVDGHHCLVGNEDLMRQHGLNTAALDHLVAQTREDACVPIFCAADGHILGVLGISETECQAWPRTSARLEKLGVKSLLLSSSDSDRQQRTAWLPANSWEVTLLGGQELSTLRAWAGPGAVIGVAADVDSEPTMLQQADLGIGLGPIALLGDEGQLALPRRNLGDLPWLIMQARRLRRRAVVIGLAAVLSRLALAVMVLRGHFETLQVVLFDGAAAVILTGAAWRLLGRRSPSMPRPSAASK